MPGDFGPQRTTLDAVFEFVWGFFTLDLGTSYGQPIIHEIGLRFELSVQVAIMATIVSILVSILWAPFQHYRILGLIIWFAHFQSQVLLCPLFGLAYLSF